MSYSTDKSITSEKEDVLGRKDFSKRLGRLIYNYQGEDGLVLGLYGEWGSGKTSVINMVEEEINRLAENKHSTIACRQNASLSARLPTRTSMTSAGK